MMVDVVLFMGALWTIMVVAWDLWLRRLLTDIDDSAPGRQV
jgi:hypothetical protein